MDINGFRAKGEIKSKELLSLKSITPDDVLELIFCAKDLKTKVRFGDAPKELNGKNIILITKNSTPKSRVAFEIATRSLGANPVTITLKGSSVDELVSDSESLKIISSYGISAVVVDTDIPCDVEIISREMNVPVINFSEHFSPISAISAILTVWENVGRLSGLKAVLVGNIDENNSSIFYGFSKCGIDTIAVSPEITESGNDILSSLTQFSSAEHTDDIELALKNADIIFPLGENFGEDYLITDEQIQKLCSSAIILHDTPLKRDVTATSEVLDSPRSLVIKYGENLLHALRAAIYLIAK